MFNAQKISKFISKILLFSSIFSVSTNTVLASKKPLDDTNDRIIEQLSEVEKESVYFVADSIDYHLKNSGNISINVKYMIVNGELTTKSLYYLTLVLKERLYLGTYIWIQT